MLARRSAGAAGGDRGPQPALHPHAFVARCQKMVRTGSPKTGPFTSTAALVSNEAELLGTVLARIRAALGNAIALVRSQECLRRNPAPRVPDELVLRRRQRSRSVVAEKGCLHLCSGIGVADR